jgi:hypothetical protein
VPTPSSYLHAPQANNGFALHSGYGVLTSEREVRIMTGVIIHLKDITRRNP